MIILMLIAVDVADDDDGTVQIASCQVESQGDDALRLVSLPAKMEMT